MKPLIFLALLGFLLALALSRNSGSTASARKTPLMAEGIYQVAVQTPCALDRDARNAIGGAIASGDEEAILGLIERGKAVLLPKGTRFELSSDEDFWAWGFVRSGRQVGRDCYLPKAVLAK